jgi:hypothetical protein
MSPDGKKVHIISEDYLDYETAYWVLVTTGVTDLAGNALEGNYGSTTTTNFTTEEEVIEEEPTSVRVTSIDRVSTYAEATGEWVDGWSWIFYITLPTTENAVSLKFDDWMSGANSIEVAENIRYYSAQSAAHADANHSVIIGGAGEYGTEIIITEDADASKAGTQIEVVVDAKIPEGSVGGSYSTRYGVLGETIEE